MIRIIAGQAKGRRLQSPAGALSRPTGARVRQTLFDILAPRLPGCRFLDACAGSGGIGLEALSRGAARVVLVELAAAAVDSIKQNARLLAGLGGDVLVLRQDARIALPALAERGQLFDVIYLDPPYASDLYEPLLEAVSSARLLAEDGVLVAERFKKRALPERIGALSRTRSARVGDHVLDFYAWT
jgi:16S rRNA (guanine(966)-N(2))-methyltransferase RsmD